MKYINKWGQYSKPRIVKGINGWFIKFKWEPYEGGSKYIQLRGGINESKDLRKRSAAAKDFIEIVCDDLRNDWNPDLKRFARPKNQQEDTWANMSLDKALEKALEQKTDIFKQTRKHYGYAINNFCKAYRKLDLFIRVKEVKPSTIKYVMEESCKNRTNIAYNGQLGYLSAVFDTLIRLSDLMHNPCHTVSRKKVKRTQGFKMPTDQDKIDLKELEFIYFNYFVVNMVIYYTALRPKEVLLLKISDIQDGHFVILPDPEKENSKTDVIGLVPIPHQLQAYLDRLDLHKYPDSYYIFGCPGFYKRGEKEDFYTPSAYPTRRQRYTYDWRKYVMEGLGIDANGYAMKHRGLVDSKKNGMSIEAIQQKCRHTDAKMTKVYLDKLMNLHSEEILDRSPDF